MQLAADYARSTGMQGRLKALLPGGAALLCAGLLTCAGCSDSSDLIVYQGGDVGPGVGPTTENLLWSAGELFSG